MKHKNFKPSEYSYLCSEHFANEDYQIRPGANVKWLKDEAVPSVFKEFPQHFQKKKVVYRLLQRNPLVDNNCDISVHTVYIQCSSSNNFENNTKSVQCSVQSPTKAILRKKVKVLQQRLKRRETKIKSLKSLVMRIKKNVPMSDDVTTQLEEHFGYKIHFVRTHFRLPHHSTYRSWMSSMECEPGYLEGVFKFLKLEITQKTWIQDCSLVFDSMSIRKQLIWEPDKDLIEVILISCVNIKQLWGQFQ
ncbi:THAP domain-containing protein 1-like isoform X5 [Myzus persicae]|uniref:THAP domain-containing protein 1-like isoform X5 n=1 Tax=Myzus persicae TaxID=13164 RepID=UPI000B932C00|nr:THAP domain-containing protein 1-like isoform X5 [Myzus persicae]